MIQGIYDHMWRRFKNAVQCNEYELDPYLLDIKSDTRRGITALAYLNQDNSAALEQMIAFQRSVQAIEPHQYYHPFDELHLTILSIISCVVDFQLSDISSVEYIEIFQSIACEIPPIEIHYKGISASPNCIVVQGFPVNRCLEVFRESLRDRFAASGVRVSFDSRYKLVTAHSSLIRFKSPITHGEELFALCEKYRAHDFGCLKLHYFDLVFNNWYQNVAVTQLLARTDSPFKENTIQGLATHGFIDKY